MFTLLWNIDGWFFKCSKFCVNILFLKKILRVEFSTWICIFRLVLNFECFFFWLSVEFPIWVCIVDKPEPTTTTETYKFNEKTPKEKQTQNTESAQKF